MSSKKECVSLHPRNAFEAWARVTDFDSSAKETQYLDEWKNEKAYQGLSKAKLKPGSVTLDTSVLHPTSIRAQYTTAKFLEMVPDEATAQDRACVAVADTTLTKEQQKAYNTKCSVFQTCTSVNDQGEFESAASLAQKASQKESKGKVVSGFCLPAVKTFAANLQNKSHYSAEIQKMRSRITELEDELASTKGGPNLRTENECGGGKQKK